MQNLTIIASLQKLFLYQTHYTTYTLQKVIKSKLILKTKNSD